MQQFKKEDIRISKTKASLITAFKDLVSIDSYDDVTINDLCKKANIRRATFYKHFKDKQDFLKFVVSEFWQKVKNDQSYTGNPDTFKSYTHSIIDYLHSNKRFIDNVLHSPTGSILPSLFVQQSYEEAKKQLELRNIKSSKLSVSVNIAASIISGGMTTAILMWYDDGMQSPKDELINEIDLAASSLFNNST